MNNSVEERFGFDFFKKPNEVGTYEKKISTIMLIL